jgi:hypothetical protein
MTLDDFKKYMVKPIFIRAIRYDGTEIMRQQLVNTSDGCIQAENNAKGGFTGNLIVGVAPDRRTYVYPGNLVIIHENGKMEGIPIEKFNEIYVFARPYELGIRIASERVASDSLVDNSSSAFLEDAADKIENKGGHK